MSPITLFQDLIASLDQHLHWLLPVLEALKVSVSWPVRFLFCALLAVSLALLRQRRAAVLRSSA